MSELWAVERCEHGNVQCSECACDKPIPHVACHTCPGGSQEPLDFEEVDASRDTRDHGFRLVVVDSCKHGSLTPHNECPGGEEIKTFDPGHYLVARREAASER